MQGYIYLHRKIIYSDIYTMPPLYLRVFERLILEANHKDNEIPFKGAKRLIKRGERLTSISQIAEWVSWYERGVRKIPNKKTISDILNWLISNGLIEIYDKGNARETHYNIVKYSVYQHPSIDKSNAIETDRENDNLNKLNSNLLENESNAKVTGYNPVISTKNENDFSSKYRSLDTNNNDNKKQYKKVVVDVGVEKTGKAKEEELFSQVVQFYQENGFGLFEGIILQEVISYFDDGYGEFIIEALKEAKLMNKVFWKYAKGCLNNWINAGIKTVGELEAHKAAFKQQKSTKQGQVVRPAYKSKSQLRMERIEQMRREAEQNDRARSVSTD